MSGLLSTDYLDLYKALSHTLRVEILSLFIHQPQDVSQLCERLHKRQPNISQHLRKLKKAEILTCEKKGKKRQYSVASRYQPLISYLDKHTI